MEDIFITDLQGEIEQYIIDKRVAKKNVINYWVEHVYRMLQDCLALQMNRGVVHVPSEIVNELYQLFVRDGFQNVFVDCYDNLRFVLDPEFDPYWINKTVRKLLLKIEEESKRGNLGYRAEFGVLNDYQGGLIRQSLKDVGFNVSQIFYGTSRDGYMEIKWT